MCSTPAVHLVDDDASFVCALTRLFRATGLDVRGFTSPNELLASVSPDARGCVVTDLSMPGMDGLELQGALLRSGVALPIVFLTGHGDIPSSVHAMRAGAVDFLEKRATQEDVLAAVHRALDSDAVAHLARMKLEELRGKFSRLTRREREVLLQVVGGRMNKQIAATLGISERTVKLHRTSITTKVGVHSAAQLATLASEARCTWMVPSLFVSDVGFDGHA